MDSRLLDINGRRNGAMRPLVDRFWEKVNIQPGYKCWEWKGATDSSGYGQIYVGGKKVQAHRLSWTLASGGIGDDLICVLHRCDNPKCVRPDHLFLGTKKDNNRAAWQKGRRKLKTYCVHGHPLTPDNVTVYTNSSGKPNRICISFNRKRGNDFYRQQRLKKLKD